MAERLTTEPLPPPAGSEEKRTTVAYCRTCWFNGDGYWLPAAEAGGECMWDECHHKLTKRRLYICQLPDHCDAMAYLNAADLAEHQSREEKRA